MTRRNASGFTLVELLVTMMIFSIVSVGFYSVMFAVVRGSDDARSVAAVSEEARMGLNRMVRDTREGSELLGAEPDSFTVRVDFENDGAGPQDLTFTKVGDEIRLDGEELVDGIDCLREDDDPGNPCQQDVFRYSSDRLQYDWDRDGITTWQELDESSSPAHGVVGIGNNDGSLNVELEFLSNVTFALSVSDGDAFSRFVAEAQLRNRR